MNWKCLIVEWRGHIQECDRLNTVSTIWKLRSPKNDVDYHNSLLMGNLTNRIKMHNWKGEFDCWNPISMLIQLDANAVTHSEHHHWLVIYGYDWCVFNGIYELNDEKPHEKPYSATVNYHFINQLGALMKVINVT